MVRAPETDPETRKYEESRIDGRVQVTFNIDPPTRRSPPRRAPRRRGDRHPGRPRHRRIASIDTTLFGRKARVPAGPFALAMAARAPIYRSS